MNPSRVLHRHPRNPLLLPDVLSHRESFAAFNGSVVPSRDGMEIFFRCIGAPQVIDGHELRLSTIGIAYSDDGLDYTQRRLFLEPGFGCEDPRATLFEGELFVFYTALGGFPFTQDNVRVAAVRINQLGASPLRHLVTPFNAKAMALFPSRVGARNQVAALLTIHTETPPSKIVLALAESIDDFFQESHWNEWLPHYQEFLIPLQRLSTDQVEIGAAPLWTPRGWLIFYAHISDYGCGLKTVYGIEAALLDLKDPRKVLSCTQGPLLVPEAHYELFGTVPGVIFPSGGYIIMKDNEVRLMYSGADTCCCMATASLDVLLDSFSAKPAGIPKGIKSLVPLLSTSFGSAWESQCVLNPAALDDGRQVHLIYRAQGPDWTSTMGHAILDPPNRLVHRALTPAYWPRADFERARKPGFSGCEDPRLTVINAQVLMLYTAYNGIDMPRVAMTSIPVLDFFSAKWCKWAMPKLITKPNEMNKDAMVFPDKIHGMYWFIHHVRPDICFDYRPTLEFDGTTQWLETKARICPEPGSWEGDYIGANTPPLRCAEGWLILYHGTRGAIYRVGVMLLDLNEPFKVVGRGRYPVIEPELDFEKFGFVNNVIFPCGWVLRGDDMWVYYGGADKAIGCVKFSLQSLIEYCLACGPGDLE